MDTKKVLGIIFSLLFVGAFAFVLSWGIINFNKVKDGMSGTGVYTKEDINKSYEDGYNTALTDKEEYTKLIASYRDTITTLNDNISQLNSQVTILQNNNKDYSNQIDKLNTQKSSLETQVNNLTTIKTNNETTIASLNSQIISLQNQVTNLTNSGEDKSEQIKTLNSQITTLQNTVSQLQTTNDMNVATITSLNTQIANLNTQISDMTLQSQNSQGQINALNNKIGELQASVTYYESYIASLENGEQVVATFEFDGSVYNIQIVNKGSKLTVTNPTSTTYKIFNGWTVNGSAIDLSTYTITTNTKIVADVTYKYDVKFKVDNTIYNSQIITKNNCATLPTNPTKDGYEFDGWSLNGVDVISDITTKQVIENTTYVAVFTKLHTVKFMYEDTIKSTQSVRNGNYANNVLVEDTTYKVFNGWKANNTIVNINSYKIVSDTVFIADITYKYDVKFKVDDTVYNSQIVTKNNCATLPNNPTKTGYEFDGWSLNGVDVISNITTKQVTENTTYVAVFTKLHTVKFMYEDTIKSTQSVRNCNYANNVSVEDTTYKVFNGWKANNVIVNINSYKIVSDTIFIADITYKYDVIFKVEDTIYNSQIVTKNSCATLPTNPTKDGYEFKGWSLNGSDIIDVSQYNVNNNLTFVACFIKVYSLDANYVFSCTNDINLNINNFTFKIKYMKFTLSSYDISYVDGKISTNYMSVITSDYNLKFSNLVVDGTNVTFNVVADDRGTVSDIVVTFNLEFNKYNNTLSGIAKITKGSGSECPVTFEGSKFK